MKSKFYFLVIMLFPVLVFYGNANGQCAPFPKWQNLMDNGKYEEAYKVAAKITAPENASKSENEAFFSKYRHSLCRVYFLAESAYKMGDLRLAFENFKNVTLYEKDYNEPELMDRYIHYAIQLGEKDFAANKLDSALEALLWAVDGGTIKHTCIGYPKAGVNHTGYLAELVGDIWVKKGNYKNALVYYQALDLSKYSPQIGEKIAFAKEGQGIRQKELNAEAKQKEIQAAKEAEERKIADKKRKEEQEKQKIIDDAEAKKRQQQEEINDKLRTVRMYGDGNTSVKINDSADYLSNAQTRTWLENSALAFSEDGTALYFRHPTDNYYQVWSVATREKLSEISFSEAGNTPKGREMIAAFPNVFYRADTHANSKIWLSADMSVSFDTKNKFTISSGQDPAAKPFKFTLHRVYKNSSLSGPEMVNTRYQLYFHKPSNKLFIVFNADSKYKAGNEFRSDPYCAVFSFDLNTNTLDILSERYNSSESNSHYTIDKWYFSNDFLLHYWGEEDKVYFSQNDLATATAESMKYVMASRKSNFIQYRPKGWDLVQHLGTDRNGVVYIVDPTNDHLAITGYDKLDKSKKWDVVKILNSTDKRNYVHFDREFSTFVSQEKHDEIWNVMAVSPSGKYIAYLSLNYRSGTGNYASIMLHNLDEKDRVYTLNDQTKYQPYIAKGYLTDQESEALTLTWEKEAEVAKQERQARYKPQLDALKAKVVALKKELDAYLKPELDLYAAGDFKTVLVRNKWTASKIYKLYEDSRQETYFYAKEDLEFRLNTSGVYATIKERLTFPASKKTKDHLLLTGDPGFSEGYVDGVIKGVQYITSSCDVNLIDWHSNEFNLRAERYFGCQLKGLEVLDEGKEFKTFGDKYLNFLMNAKFKLILLADNTFFLTAEATNGLKMSFSIPETVQQMTLDGKMNDLRKEIKKLEDFVESGK